MKKAYKITDDELKSVKGLVVAQYKGKVMGVAQPQYILEQENPEEIFSFFWKFPKPLSEDELPAELPTPKDNAMKLVQFKSGGIGVVQHANMIEMKKEEIVYFWDLPEALDEVEEKKKTRKKKSTESVETEVNK
jgi:hypothetical protein